MRQLFHLKVIEAYTGLKKSKEKPKTTPFKVEVSPDLKDKLAETCDTFQLKPNLIVKNEVKVFLT